MTDNRKAAYVVETARVLYYLDMTGQVIARTNGPRGWDYGVGTWLVLGFLRRWNSTRVVTLTDAAIHGADIGHAYVVDIDHGTRRQWGERATAVRRANAFDQLNAARMMRSETELTRHARYMLYG